MPAQLIALLSAIFYGSNAIYARLGLRFTNPLTAACIALSVRAVTLWSAVFLAGGIPQVARISLLLFVLLGIVQTATSLLTLTGIHRIGASRSAPLRNTYPLWSAIIAIAVLQEEAGFAVLMGTLLVVAGIVLISWSPGGMASTHRWWHALFSLGAALLAGIAFPIRRYALGISNEPLFFAALLALISLAFLPVYRLLPIGKWQFPCHRKALLHLIVAGGFETLGALLSLVAVSAGQVVVVAPIVATSPFWTLVLTVILLRGIERVNTRTVLGTVGVITGSVAIILRG